MALKDYWKKRDFEKTKEPSGKKAQRALQARRKSQRTFVIQKHDASHLHYDFRLEIDGVLKSWAVPKGPSLDPKEKRLAVEVEDHPLDYGSFEGSIPIGEYGGGDVIVWDRGEWIINGNAREACKKGNLEFELRGEKLHGRWRLVRARTQGRQTQWLLMKRNDAWTRSIEEYDIVADKPESVITGSLLPREQASKIETPARAKNQTRKHTRVGQARASRSRSAIKKTNRTRFPGFISPQLAKLADRAPEGADWIHEIKYDGYRTLATIEGKNAKLYSRNGLDWTSKYKTIASAFKKLQIKDAIFDGEVVWADENGVSSFSKLQSALKDGKDAELVYFIFDLLWLNGEDLRERSLLERKDLLKAVLADNTSANIRFSEHWNDHGPYVHRAACDLQMEGIISKRANSTYESTRSGTWLKVKCTNGQEFIIAGYTIGKGARAAGFGALILGVRDDEGQLRYVGRVGTGFDSSTMNDLLKKFRQLKSPKSFFDILSPTEKDIRWLKPELVANVRFTEWTADGILRHPVFEGLREDKTAKSVKIEKEEKIEKLLKNASKTRLTHPDKVLFSKSGETKRRVAEYYERVAKRMIPYIANRPVALVRCPDGTGAPCFFQKKKGAAKGDSIRTHLAQGREGETEEIINIDDASGLTELVQMSAFEVHVWGCSSNDLRHPNMIVFDLDPDENVSWNDVRDTALKLKEMLSRLGLKSFVKTTGGKGLHIHVPIAPLYSYDDVKAFSKALSEQFVRAEPSRYTVELSKSRRKGKIFIDYLRNGYGSTAVAAYSVRARPNARIAMPIRWSELKKLKAADQFTIEDGEKRVKTTKDPWDGYFGLEQKLPHLQEDSESAPPPRKPSSRFRSRKR